MDLQQTEISLAHRLRRNRRTEAIRSMIRETQLHAADLIAPLFVVEGYNVHQPILSMPNINRLSIDRLIQMAAHLQEQGVQAIALFPVLAPEKKSETAEEAWNPLGLIPRAIRALKETLPSLCVIADVALDPYTNHGHDGLVDSSGEVLNDPTVHCLCKMALVLADAGVDFVAPSDMMDGRIRAIRSALDLSHFHSTGIIAYSIKYASALYHTFRDALHSQLKFGNKKTYQLDPANAREALLEATLDEEEGADILIVKPATFYLDIIAKLRTQTNRPIAAYHVSGEYSLVMAAHNQGFLKAEDVFLEALFSIKRAGADMIFSYATPMILPFL